MGENDVIFFYIDIDHIARGETVSSGSSNFVISNFYLFNAQQLAETEPGFEFSAKFSTIWSKFRPISLDLSHLREQEAFLEKFCANGQDH